MAKVTGALRAVALGVSLLMPGVSAERVMADVGLRIPTPEVCGDTLGAAARQAAGKAADRAADVITTASYLIFSGRDRIGALDSVRRRDESGRHLAIHNHLRIDIDEFLWSYTLDVLESVCIVDRELEQYNARFEEDGETSHLRASRAKGERLVVSGVDAAEGEFEEVVDGASFGALSEFAVASVIEEQAAESTRTVLDLDDLEIKPITYRYGGTAEVTVGGQSYKAHVVEFRAPTKQGTYWMVADHDGYVAVLERGEDPDGEYSLELQSLVPPASESLP